MAATTSSGISASARCQAWACGAIRSSVNWRNWSRTMSSVSSPRLSSGCQPSVSRAARAARASAVLPWSQEPGDGRVPGQLGRGVARLQVRGPDDLVLAHRQAAQQLGQVLAEADAQHQLLAGAEPAGAGQALRPGGQLRQRLDGRRGPGEAVHLALPGLHQGRVDAPVGRHRILAGRLDGADVLAAGLHGGVGQAECVLGDHVVHRLILRLQRPAVTARPASCSRAISWPGRRRTAASTSSVSRPSTGLGCGGRRAVPGSVAGAPGVR